VFCLRSYYYSHLLRLRAGPTYPIALTIVHLYPSIIECLVCITKVLEDSSKIIGEGRSKEDISRKLKLSKYEFEFEYESILMNTEVRIQCIRSYFPCILDFDA
jgi:hypothetical protein